MKRYIPFLVFIALIIGVQAAASAGGAEYYLTQLTMSAYYALVVIGLCVLMGYAGQISIGHAAFFAIGGYTAAVLTTRNLAAAQQSPVVELLSQCGLLLSRTDLYGTQILYLSPWISLIAAVLISIIIAFIIGIPVLKLKGHYLAMATLGFGTIIYRIVLGTRLFGEADGISDLPPFKIFSLLTVSGDPALRVQNYYIAWFLTAAGMLLLLNLINSRTGRALRAIHGNEGAAASMGINTARHKLMVFIVSAVFASVAGVFLTHYNGGIGPSEASIMKSIRYVAIVAAGGMANLWGSLFMAVVLNFLSLRGYFGTYDDAVFGCILIAIMLFAPNGLLRTGKIREWTNKVYNKRKVKSGKSEVKS